MSTSAQRRRTGWWVAGLTAVVAATASLLLFQPLAPGAAPVQPASTPSVVVARLDHETGGGLLREQATLLDPTPLFLPTEWNTNQRPLPAAIQHQPGQVFRRFEPTFLFEEAALSLPVRSPMVVPRSPKELLTEPSHDPFLGFDREDLSISPLAPRPGFVEVREAGTGKIELAQSLEGSLALPAHERGWQPAEFLVAVTATGLLGGPTETTSSEVEEVDAFFRDYLARSLHLGERLPPGIYRVVVGP
jgi:hypothetical protein